MPSSAPLLTVITVVRDAPEALRETAASVAGQELADRSAVEHLVIDGSTIAADLTELPGVRHEMRPPRGIYAAMNDGLQAATGEYAYFLNAGDTLDAVDTLAFVVDRLGSVRPEWAYGEVAIVDGSGVRTVTPRWDFDAEASRCFARGLFPPHQGTFARRETLLALGGFDESYRIAADYAMALRLSQRSAPAYLDRVIATFPEGGASTVGWRDAQREFHRARISILQPTGMAAVREQLDTARQRAAMTAYRGVWARLR